MTGTIPAPALSSGAPPWKGGGGGSKLSDGMWYRVGESAERTLDTEHGAVQSLSRGEDLSHLLLVPARAADGPARSVSRATRRPLLGSRCSATPGPLCRLCRRPATVDALPSENASLRRASIHVSGALVGDHQGLFHDGAMLRGRYRPVPEGPRDIRQGCHRHRRPGGRLLISSCISPDGPRTGRHLSPERVMMRQGRQAHNRAVRPKEKPRECANTPGP